MTAKRIFSFIGYLAALSANVLLFLAIHFADFALLSSEWLIPFIVVWGCVVFFALFPIFSITLRNANNRFACFLPILLRWLFHLSTFAHVFLITVVGAPRFGVYVDWFSREVNVLFFIYVCVLFAVMSLPSLLKPYFWRKFFHVTEIIFQALYGLIFFVFGFRIITTMSGNVYPTSLIPILVKAGFIMMGLFILLLYYANHYLMIIVPSSYGGPVRRPVRAGKRSPNLSPIEARKEALRERLRSQL